MHRVTIQQASYDNCRDGVNKVFESFPLAIKAKKVLIKPNVLRASGADD